MFKTLLTQTGWSLMGTIFGFVVGFFVKMYLVNKVGAESFGLYTIAVSFQGAVSTLVALGMPQVIIKFLPKFLDEDNEEKTSVFTTKTLSFLLVAGTASALLIIASSTIISTYFFQKPNLTYILALAAIYIPLSLYSAYITSIYRSFLKIKEIILYGTIYLISIRATLTFIVFAFTSDITYFLLIEILSMFLSSFLLTIHFKSEKMHLFKPDALKKVLPKKKEILDYAKTIYANSLIGFAGGYVMTFIMSILLPASAIGVFAILMTIAGLTNFLQSNINNIFAPMISKLVNSGDIKELSLLYKESTFLLNFATIPFIVTVVLFSKDILSLYGEEFVPHTFELMVLFLANYFSLAVGSSGMMMMMGGLEKEELRLQIFILVLTIVLSLLFLPTYGLLAVVFIKLAIMFTVNMVEVYYIHQRFKIWPWDINSYFLMAIFATLLTIAYKYHDESFGPVYFISIPFFLYLFFAVIFSKKLLEIKKVLFKNER